MGAEDDGEGEELTYLHTERYHYNAAKMKYHQPRFPVYKTNYFVDFI